jgi:hypothetical protein
VRGLVARETLEKSGHDYLSIRHFYF